MLVSAAVFGTSIATLLLAGAFLLILHIYIRQIEEPHLSHSFGDSYESYREETYRCFGRSGIRGEDSPR